MQIRREFKIKSFILDTLFPRKCIYCTKIFDTYLCKNCFKKIKFRKQIPIKDLFLDRLYILCEYDEVISKLLQEFKYNYIIDIKDIIEDIINKSDLKLNINGELVPIPLHKKRMIERGFNQSEIIADLLNKKLSFPVDNSILKRVKNIKKQSLLNRKKRLQNVKNAFILNKRTHKIAKSIILVDDVYTTGATMQECAKLLKEQGNVEYVYGIVLARGKIS